MTLSMIPTHPENIPAELRERGQWLCWRYEQRPGESKPTKVPIHVRTGGYASVTDPTTWCSFEEAVAAVAAGKYDGIGFVFSVNDPYFFIDLDATDNPDEIEKHDHVRAAFAHTYSERSISGAGQHIIGIGASKVGRRRYHIELYSTLRFAVMTGDVINDAPLADCQYLVDELFDDLGRGHSRSNGHDGETIEIVGDIQRLDDDQIITMATNAKNGEKFTALWEGRWQGLFRSQSEADLALMNIIVFYTQNIEQIKRLFFASALGQRPKAEREDYINMTIKLAFDQQLPPIEIVRPRWPSQRVRRLLECGCGAVHIHIQMSFLKYVLMLMSA